MAFRPISLSGLENNNGWIKIQNEEYFPPSPIECMFIVDNEIYSGWYTLRSFNGRLKPNSIVTNFSIEMVSHYMHMKKPKPPIY